MPRRKTCCRRLFCFARRECRQLADRSGACNQDLRRCCKCGHIVFPVHPRTRANIEKNGLTERLQHSAIRLIEPLGYIDFMNLVSGSALTITDSGGVQEETSYLGIPCLTLRPNTERPITISLGTNRLVTPETVLSAATAAIASAPNSPPRIPLWDGQTAPRVAASLARHCGLASPVRATEH
ncbi:MAG: UDP-N-acetylglucosamine 2-epimerase [Pseudomonadota bacterium]